MDELLIRLGHVPRVEALLEVKIEHRLLHVLRALLQACARAHVTHAAAARHGTSRHGTEQRSAARRVTARRHVSGVGG